MRDLCRLPLERQADREALLAAYFAPAAVPGVARRSYELARRSFLGKNRAKTRLRALLVARGHGRREERDRDDRRHD